MHEPALLAPGEGERIRPGYHIKAAGEALVMTESVYEAGQRGPGRHVHHHHVDAFFVLGGELELEVGGEDLRLPEGGFALAPPMVVHTFRNPGPARARFLNFHAPGMGFEDYIRGKADFDQHEPPADGGAPASEAIVRRPGEGEELALGPSTGAIKVGAGDALGSLAVVDVSVAPGFPGPVPHRHEATIDSFYVLEGTLTLRLGERTVEAVAGSYGLVPPGNAHTFSNPGDRPVRLLNIMAPADDFRAV